MRAVVDDLAARVDTDAGELLDARIALHDLCTELGSDNAEADALRQVIADDDRVLERFSRSNVRQLVVRSAENTSDEQAVRRAIRRFADYLGELHLAGRPDIEHELAVRYEYAGLLKLARLEEDAAAEYTEVIQRNAELFGLNHPNTMIAFFESGGGADKSGVIRSEAARTIDEYIERFRHDPHLVTRLKDTVPANEKAVIQKIIDTSAADIYDSDFQKGVVVFSGLLCIRAFTAPDKPYGDVLQARRNYCYTLLEQGMADTAAPFLRDLLVACIARKGDRSKDATATDLLLIRALYEIGRFDEASAGAETLLRGLPDDSNHALTARVLLAKALLEQGEPDRASAAILGIPEASSTLASAKVEFELADAFLANGNLDAVVTHLGRILQAKSKSDGAYWMNSMVVAARLEHVIGDGQTEHTSAPWFDDYRRLLQAINRAVNSGEDAD